MVNYGNGKIYKLVNNVDDKIYIGSTCSKLSKRKGQHKANRIRLQHTPIYKHFNEVGWDNVEIVLIENFECLNKDELHKRERYWIDELKPVLNQRSPITDNKEYIKEYRRINKDRLNAVKRRTKNCICGFHYSCGHKARHEQSTRHLEFINRTTNI